MNMQIVWISLILVAALILLVTEKMAVDKTAMGIMVTLALTGILTPAQTVAGFANPAVITVGAMFLLSHGLIHSGSVDVETDPVLRFSKGRS